MATSGSIDYTVSRDDIITEALEQLGVLGEGEPPNADQVATCSRTLNMLSKNWQARGLNLFAVQRTYLFLELGKKEYDLNINSSSRFVTGFLTPTTTADTAAGGDTLTVDSSTGVGAGDTILIPKSDNTVQQTTIASVPTSTSMVTTDILEDDLTSGTRVFTYAQSQKANRPMDLLEAYTIVSDDVDIPLERVSRSKYNDLANKTAVGLVNQVYYDPQIDTSTISVWPTTENETTHLKLLVQRTLEDFDNGADNPDFPQEWYLPLALNLAVLLGPKFGVPIQRLGQIKMMAEEAYQAAEDFDTELQVSVFLQPDNYRGGS